jgi:hypothetical protein
VLTDEDIRVRALSRADLQDDAFSINASVVLVRRTRGGGWPTGPVDEDSDHVWHELEFREGCSFADAVHDTVGQHLGCSLHPVGRRTELTDELLAHDVDVSWWAPPTRTAPATCSGPPPTSPAGHPGRFGEGGAPCSRPSCSTLVPASNRSSAAVIVGQSRAGCSLGQSRACSRNT